MLLLFPQAGCLKPLLDLCKSPSLEVQRDAAGSLAHLTSREDIRARVVELGGLPRLLALCSVKDEVRARAAAECVANVAQTPVLRGKAA